MKAPARPKRPPIQRKPQIRGEVTRERLLEVARDEFVLRGYHGTSMRQIAAAAGLAVGGIYNHFGGKDEIFAAVLEANHPYRVVEAALHDVSLTTPEAFMREAATRVWQAMEGRRRQLMPLMYIEVVEFQGRHMQALAKELVPKVLRFVQHFDQSGEGHLRRPAPEVLRALISLMVGHLMIESALGEAPVFQVAGVDWLAANLDIFLHGALE